VKKLAVNGKSHDELANLLKSRRRKDLLSLIAATVSLDQHFTALEIARARKMPKRVVIAKMKSGELRGHHSTTHRWTSSLSEIRQWDESTAVKPLSANGG
jgi:hypothetical protein